MNTGIVVITQRRLLALVLATALALTAIVGPMAVEQLTGAHLTPSAAACVASGGGC